MCIYIDCVYIYNIDINVERVESHVEVGTEAEYHIKTRKSIVRPLISQ